MNQIDILTGVSVYRINPLHMTGHDLDASLFGFVVVEKRVVRLKVEHARCLFWVHWSPFAKHSGVPLSV